jgi:hypothetical protein
VTVADDIRQLRFQIADDLVNTLVCHHIWGISHDSDTQLEADRIADFGFRVCKIFLNLVRQKKSWVDSGSGSFPSE